MKISDRFYKGRVALNVLLSPAPNPIDIASSTFEPKARILSTASSTVL